MIIETKIDRMAELAASRKTLTSLAKELSWKEESVEKIALILEKAGLAKLSYPITMIEKPSVQIPKKEDKKKPDEETGKLLKKYEINSTGSGARGSVTIYQSEKDRRPRYLINLGEVSLYTRAYLEEVKVEASKVLAVYGEEKSSE